MVECLIDFLAGICALTVIGVSVGYGVKKVWRRRKSEP